MTHTKKVMLYHPHSFPGGGVQTVSSMLASYFSGRGWDVFIAMREFQEALVTAADREAVKGFLLRPRAVRSDRAVSRWVAAQCVEHGLDIVVFQGYLSCDMAFLRSLVPGVRFVFCCHNPPMWEVTSAIERRRIKADGSFLRRLALRLWVEPFSIGLGLLERSWRRRYALMIGGCDGVVLLCEGYREALEALVEGCAGRCVAIPNATTSRPLLAPLDAPRRRWVYAGRLVAAQKRVDRVLRLWSRVQGEFEDWALDIVGDGPDRARLEALAQELGLERVTWHGWQGDSAPFYASGSLFPLTSQFEGWPMTLGEAMQQGCVPFAYGVTAGVCELIGDGGVVVEPFDEDAYVAALRRVMSDPALRLRMSEGAVERCGAFSVETMGASYEVLFNQILKR